MSVLIWPPSSTSGGVTPPPPGSMANYTYTASSLATMPPVGSLADGTLVFVESNRSWYRSDLALNVYRREPIADASWLEQTAWGIDSAAGNDENVGTVASPLRTVGELMARLPQVNRDTTITVAAGSAFGANDWLSWSPQIVSGAQATIPTITFNGTRTLGAPLVVASSSDEVGNFFPTIDANAVLVPGTLLQATSGASSGATCGIVEGIAATQYRTGTWRSAGGARVAPPAPGDTISTITLPSIARVEWSSGSVALLMQNMDIANIDRSTARYVINFRVCTVAGALLLTGTNGHAFGGCVLNCAGGFQFSNARVLTQQSVIRLTPTIIVDSGSNFLPTDTVISLPAGNSLVVQNGGYIESTSLGIRGAAGALLSMSRGGMHRVRGTLYGANSAGLGTQVVNGGRITVDGVLVPTLAASGQELSMDASAVAIPALVGGAVVPNTSPLATWANWNAAPFTRFVVSYFSGSSIMTS